MKVQLLEVYSSDSNYAVIKPPGRNYPGCVIQGDSLGSLCRTAKALAQNIQHCNIKNKDLLDCMEELTNSLNGRILHYQRVLDEHGIDYPHVHVFSTNDLVHLLPVDEDEEQEE